MAGQCFPGEENRAALTCHAALAATLTDERELMLIFCYTLLYFLRFMAGACVFSFLGVVAYRLPKGESFIKGRSYCPSCGHALNALDLVPVLSFLALRGRCRHCGAKIGARYLAVDALGGAVSVLSCISFGGENARTLWAFAFCGVLLVVALMDIDTLEILDRMHVILLALGVIAVFLFPETPLRSRLLGFVIVSVPMLLVALFVPGGFGGGDIKLMAACGFALGARLTVVAAFFGVLTGGLYGVYLLAAKRAGRKTQFAFGPFLCVGLALSLFFGRAIAAWYLGLLHI